MTDEIPEIIDRSRVDAYAATRRRAMLFHSLWRPTLAGAVGAALVIAAVAIAQPRFTTREVVVDHVVQKDVAVDHVVPHDVPVDHIIPHDVPIEIPKIVRPEPGRRPLADFPDRALVGTIVSADTDQVCIRPPNGEAPGCVSPALVDVNGKAILDSSGEVRRDPAREYGPMQEAVGHEAYQAPSPSDPGHLSRYWWRQDDTLIAFDVRPTHHASVPASQGRALPEVKT